jgi:hypothetical protein
MRELLSYFTIKSGDFQGSKPISCAAQKACPQNMFFVSILQTFVVQVV